MTAGHCRDSAIGSRLPIYARHAARLGDGGARGRSAASPGGIGVRADRCRSAVLGSSKSGPSRNGFWPATRQGCTPSSRSRDSLLGRSTLPHQEGDHAGAGRGGRGGWRTPDERRQLVPWAQEAERIGVPAPHHRGGPGGGEARDQDAHASETPRASRTGRRTTRSRSPSKLDLGTSDGCTIFHKGGTASRSFRRLLRPDDLIVPDP
jgi:hypothetical protein